MVVKYKIVVLSALMDFLHAAIVMHVGLVIFWNTMNELSLLLDYMPCRAPNIGYHCNQF